MLTRAVATLMAGVCLGAVSAYGQDATWVGGNAGDPNEWVENNNWSSATVPTGTATFTNSGVTSVANDNGIVSIGAINFTNVPNAQAYTFSIDNSFLITGVGVTNNSTNTQTFNVTSGNSLVFQNSATANAGIGAVQYNNSSFIFFQNTSNAGNAFTTIINDEILQFNDTSFAGSAHITNNVEMDFFDSTSAGSATIVNAAAGTLTLNNNATAGNATITNNGAIQLNNQSTAGSATITNSNNATLTFSDTSTAGSANISNIGTSISVTFNDSSSAGSATFTANPGTNGAITFNNSSTAGSAKIQLVDTTLIFNNSSNAGSAIITMPNAMHTSNITFNDTSSAGTANITNVSSLGINNVVQFLSASTAGNATITNNPGIGSGGQLQFGTLGGTDTANAGTATIINNSAGTTSFLAATSALSAMITNNSGGGTNFQDQSTAAGATIINNSGGNTNFGVLLVGTDTATAGTANITNNSGGATRFNAATTAGSATVTTNSGGSVFFTASSTGGNARFITNAGGTFDISGLTTTGMTAGSIEGAGNDFLGSRNLTVGSNNLSTTVSGVISDGGTNGGAGGSVTKVGSGTLTLSGANTYTGATDVQAGRLVVNGSLASPSVIVENGATLGGSGTITNGVTIANGGTLAPGNSPGTITLGTLTLNSGSILAYDLGTANTVGGSTNDLTNVTGNLVLAGTLNVTDSGGFGLGAYRIINYGGTLTNNGLAIGTLPGSFTGVVQTAIAGQVNLIVNGPGALVQYWDGSTTSGDGTIHGGTGTWNNANTNWTSPNGTINASWQGGFGIFAGAAGTVTVAAALTYQGLQFSTDGYVVTASGGGTLSPVGQAPIRVDAGVTATVAAPIVGSGGLLKSDAGTLILTGSNTYTGGTTISGGTLQLGNGGTSGSIVGDIVDNGVLAINRSDTLLLSGAISGSGAFRESGPGTTVLTGTNTYTGGTTISAGTLQLGNGGTSGSIVGDVVDNGVIAFNRSDIITFAGAISGTGTLQQNGSGITKLTGANTYTGGTTINAGTLQIGAGGANATSGSIVGNATDNGILAFGRSDSFTFSGVISGTGTVVQQGVGITTLSGTNTYSGGTILNSGILAVGSNANLGATSGGIVFQGGTLRALASFNSSRAVTINAGGGTIGTNGFDVGWSGVISGVGGLTKNGGGTLTLLATNTYTGGTTIAGGALRLGNGGTAGSIVGDVVDNGVFTFNRSDNITFAGVVSGTGSVNQLGPGTLTLSGANTYSGGTTVTAGTLAIAADNNIGTGPLALLAGTTLQFTQGFTFTHAVTVAGGATIDVATGNTNTMSGAIADGASAGNVAKTGAGTLILTGSNTYTGGTTISAGTLQLGNGGTSGSIVGNVVNNGVFTFNRSDIYTFAGVISGTGTVNQNGSGTVSLTGASTYTGPTNVNAGILSVDGSLTSTVNVNNGAALMGNGTIGGLNVASGGVVAPGHSIGQTNVAGNVSFASGSTYQVEANAAGQSDKIVATGKATLTGGTIQVLAASGSYGVSTTYTILTSAGGVSGTFSRVTANLAFLTPALSYDADDVFLTLTRNASFFSSVAQTFNQRAVAGALDASPFGSVLVQAVLPLSVPQSLQAFDALSGEIHGSLQTSLIDDSRHIRDAILGRLRTAGYAGAGGGLAPLAFGGPEMTVSAASAAIANAAPDTQALAYGMVTKAPVYKAPLPSYDPDLTFWSQGYGAWGRNDGDGNAAKMDRSGGGVFVGVDRRFADIWRLGFAAGYSRSDITVDQRASSADIDTFHAAVYAGATLGPWSLRTGAALAWHDIDTSRSIVFPGFFDTARASYHGSTSQVFGEVGYGMAFGQIAVEPFAGMAYVHFETNGFSETGSIGAASALTGAGNNDDVGFSSLGIRFATSITLQNGMIVMPRGLVAWQHAFGDVTPSAALAFQSTGAAFDIHGVPLARDSALVEAGLDFKIVPNMTVGISYTGELASDVQDHAVKGRMTWRF